ncbi:UDP-N-acetylmuramoyl-L-alanine--D-glutamate ligase [Anaerococcus sp. NML200537]|uniref:UDP-N-acetylmuramoyl-L-alanine--D-glutamate ligase n=1 Tax=Anaerococcus sp. NML200537 TaxID=2954485 RepID=UPI0022386503|nr:UDP-N-acetylmuramoyl-L-alanine--D-glutamate ligase [Anaerococcus sp. NML200537]MCW6701766.1 UDP-N-acetylmuramoyl-L-alanine--D-glutamate ligase [Anaerococcus sp. NML200537]
MSKVLVYGLGVTGISSVKCLDKKGYEVYTFDKNKEKIEELKGYNYSPISCANLEDYKFEFVLKSPGIKPNDEYVELLEKRNEIISDIEASQRLFPEKEKIAITGTNGKTSTTSMVNHILNQSDHKAYAVGNIGEGILWQMYNNEGVFVEELSSFQLHDSKLYHPKFAAILNINEDHIDWHGSFDDYINSKLKISSNQDQSDVLVINKDDRILQDNKLSFKAKVYEFSSRQRVERGLYLKENTIYLIDENHDDEGILDVRDLSVIGRHNYENAMAAILLTYLYGIKLDDIIKSINTFKSIAHRLEFVKTIDGVDYYNDSKGTNVDSSVKAIESFDRPIIIIAGGYDKHIDYTDYVKAFKKNGKLMIIMGQTKQKLENICKDLGVSYIMVENMKEALDEAYKEAKSGDVVLLSPASASWDMYKSYEQRGDDFKDLVKKLG